MKSLMRMTGMMAALALTASGAEAATWLGGGDGTNWFDGANWDPTGVPGNGAAVAINAGATVLLTNETAELTSFTMTGGTLTFSNWTTRLRATTVTVSGGTLTLPPAFANNAMSNRVWVVCTNFTLGADGIINVDKKGYAGSQGPGGAPTTTRRGGGGHGGRGGSGDVEWYVGNTNGAVHAPLNPGSGGSGNIAAGGAGGGAVLIEATGTADLRGVITANGQGANDLGASGGGGSGGSIYIVCNTFDGASGARLSARGGRNGSNAAHGGGGGGGRIAVDYVTANAGAAHVRFTTAPGAGYSETAGGANLGWFYRTDWGTLSLSDATLLTGTPATQQFDRVNLYFRDLTAWTVADLMVISNAFVLATPGLTMTVEGDLTVGTSGHFGIGEAFGDSNSVLTVGNRLMVTNGGVFEVYAGMATPALDGFGAGVVVSNRLAVAPSSWIYPYSHGTKGGSVRFQATNVTVAAGGGFNAFARGYHGAKGPGAGTRSGQRGTGGGHGGRGGASDIHVGGGSTNGLAAWPGPGSGGADISGYPSILGGGLVHIEAASVTLDGTVNANGAPGAYGNYGGGAGGGILIACDTLAGQAPLLTVNGGNRNSAGGGAGGGGRMALHYNSIALQTPRFQASPGICQHTGLDSSSWQLVAGEGTLWCSDTSLLATTLDGDRFKDVCFLASNFTAWTVPSLTISNTNIRFGEDGFALTVTGSLTIGTNGVLRIGAYSGNVQPALTCGGDLRVGNGGALHVYAAKTNAAGLGASVDVTGALIVETNGWVYPYTHEYHPAGGGGAPRFKAGSLTVAAGGGFKAIGQGYRMQQGPNQGTQASQRSPGAGYGGRGGDHKITVGSGGGTNGLPLAPILPGSGSCRADSGSGGGVIWIELSGTASVDGLLAADGAFGFYNHQGGGAGGSVLVRASGIRAGTGSVWRAHGGNGRGDGGGGGGGRIAVWRRVLDADADVLFAGQEPPPRLQDRIATNAVMFSQFQADVSVKGGTGWAPGEAGTIRFIDGVYSGTIILIR